jgi:hypothetical protein
MPFNIVDWYWSDGTRLYGSSRNALVATPASDDQFQNWVIATDRGGPGSWPMSNGAPDDGALAQVLITAGIVPPFASLAQLQALLIAAASAACAAVTKQIYTDPAHQAAGQNAGVIVAMAGGAPTSSSPSFAAFNTYAAAWGLTPAAFATLVEALTNQSLALSSALNALEGASAAATTADQLATALSTFEAALESVVTAINAAGTPFPMTVPAAISIVGINA